MRYIIVLLLANNPIYVPFDSEKNCFDQGEEIIETIATYQGPGINQGWYMDNGALIYGFYCE